MISLNPGRIILIKDPAKKVLELMVEAPKNIYHRIIDGLKPKNEQSTPSEKEPTLPLPLFFRLKVRRNRRIKNLKYMHKGDYMLQRVCATQSPMQTVPNPSGPCNKDGKLPPYKYIIRTAYFSVGNYMTTWQPSIRA